MKRRAFLFAVALTAGILGAYPGSGRAEDKPAPGTAPASAAAASPAPGASPARAAGSLGPLAVEVRSSYLWRNWQPIVTAPAKDGGSPLQASLELKFDNPGSDSVQFSWEVELKPTGAKDRIPLHMEATIDGKTFGGVAAPKQKGTITLSTDRGPVLQQGSKASLWIHLKSKDGKRLTIQTPEETVSATQ